MRYLPVWDYQPCPAQKNFLENLHNTCSCQYPVKVTGYWTCSLQCKFIKHQIFHQFWYLRVHGTACSKESKGSFCFSGALCLFTKIFETFFCFPSTVFAKKLCILFTFCAYKMHTCALIGTLNISLKCLYDENRIFSIEAILKHIHRKMLFTIFKYLFLFLSYSSFQNMQISQVTMS